MYSFTYTPSKPLSKIVRYIWYQENYQPSGQTEKVLPGGSSQIIINLESIPFRHLSSDFKTEYIFDDFILTGVHSKPVFLDSTTRISTIGIVLKEGAIPSLFNIPASEFHNQVIPLKDLLLTDLTELKAKLHKSKVGEKLLALEEYITKRLISCSLTSNPAACYAVDQIRKSKGKINITDILNKTGYTRRWFINLFRETAGITPKRFARLIRFQHTLDLLQTVGNPQLTDIALQCGYYDQPHLNHDFQEFSGLSPLEYFNHRGKEKNHLFINNE